MRPLSESAGTFNSTAPPSVGTLRVAPSAACHGVTGSTWISIVYLGALSSGLAYLLWYQALAEMPVAKLIVFQFLQPVAGMVISYFLIGERYTIWIGLGAAMIMSGIWLVNRR